MMKAVFLDYKNINLGDLDWHALEGICKLEAYETSTREEAVRRAKDAEILLADSFVIDCELMRACPKLKLICVTATGYNHIDIEAADELEIAVVNVPDYSREAVAQHAMALLLDITNKVSIFCKGRNPENLSDSVPVLLDGKSMGIIGYGSIGSRVAEIAKSFGMKINVYSRDKDATMKSDVVSLHCPLNEDTRGMVDRDFISEMKDGAILINTARGGLVDEEALSEALKSGKLLAAGLDVTVNEPPEDDCPLLQCENCRITPHMAFMDKDTREKVLDITAENIAAFIRGESKNRIV